MSSKYEKISSLSSEEILNYRVLGVKYHDSAPDLDSGGRNSYVINLNRGGSFTDYIDQEYYLDISVTPLVKK